MLEIIGIIFFARKIGSIAQEKGLPVGWWRFYAVLAWILGEFTGGFIGGLLDQETIVILLLAYLCAGIACFTLYKIVSSKPDVMHEFDFDKQDNTYQ